MKRIALGALLSVATAASSAPAATALKLTPQNVVDLALTRSTRVKAAELNAEKNYVALQKVLGVFDLQFSLAPGFEYNKAETLSGSNNLVDRTVSTTAALQKRFRSGSVFGLSYINTQQNSTLPSTSTRTPSVALNAIELSVSQALWRNAFGYGDRLALEAAELGVQGAVETREERLEDILLDAMTYFWNTFIAERQLKENLAAREKYEQLVKNVRRKAGFNLSTPGELPRLEAELEASAQKVKASSAVYLNAVGALLTYLRVDTKGPLELVVPDDLPPVPQLKAKDIESLRNVRILRRGLVIAEKALASVRSANHPQLDLVLRARATGVEEQNDAALAEMQGGTKPTYYVGLQFSTPIGSDLQRAGETEAELNRQIAENELTALVDATRDQLLTLDRLVVAQYAVAKSAVEIVELRARVVRDLESAYRQGRQPLVELIRSYNDLFTAQLEKARAVGQYHINLNQLAAARDELVANVGRAPRKE